MLATFRLNQKGLTMIELLITLALLSTVAGVVFSVFINGIHTSNKSQTVTELQQEANYVLKVLNNEHLYSKFYSIEIQGDGSIKVISTHEKNQTVTTNIVLLSNPQYTYEVVLNILSNGSRSNYINGSNINPNTMDLSIQLTVKDNVQNEYSVHTVLSKMKLG